MNYKKVRQIEDRLVKNRRKLMVERNPKKKSIMRLRIGIDELKVKLERLK